MPSYKITAPDGHSYKVTVPEGATEQDVLKHLQSQLRASSEPADPYKETAQNKEPLSKNSALAKRLLNSPVGGIIRGIRDIPDAGAELLLSGLNAISPSGTSMDSFTKKELDRVRGINKAAESDYKQNWRGGEDVGFDGGRLTGNILASYMIPGSQTYLRSGIIGGGLGLLNADENSKGEGAAMGAIGGVLGNAGGRLISNLFKPVPRLPDAGRQTGVSAADNLGVPLLPGERTGSLALRQVESVLERTPGSAGMFDVVKDLKQKALNKAAAKSIGESTDTLTEDVIAKASQRISDGFNDIYRKTTINLGDDFLKSVQKIEASNLKLGPYRNAKVDDVVNKSKELLAMKSIPPDVYQLIRTELTMGADDAYRAGNSVLGKSLKSIRNSLDDAARNSLSKDDQAALDVLRKQYAHLKTLTKGNTIEAGNVKPHLVNNALAKFNPDLYKAGSINSPLNDIGRYSQTFKTAVPNSGSPERTAMYNMMFGNPITGLPITGLANLYGRTYLSQPMQRYLTKGIVDLSPEVQRILATSGGLTGAYLGSTANQ